MAVTRQKTKKTFLGDIIKSNLNSFIQQRDALRAEEEATYWRKVTQEGMGYQEQIDYREKQLEEEKDKRISDKNFMEEVKNEIASLKKLKREEDYKNAYRQSVEDLNTNNINISQHINFLERTLEDTKDPTLKSQINDNLKSARVNQQEIRENVLTNRATYAETTKSKQLLSEAISDVQKERNKALLSGNEDLISKWDSKLFSLKNTLKVEEIQDSFDVLRTRKLTEDLKSTDILQFYNNNVAKAGNESVIINGTKYDTTKDFWNDNLSTYINDKFFSLYESEVSNKISNASKQLTPMLETQLRQINTDLDEIKAMPNMEAFQETIEQSRTKINSEAVTRINNKIIKDYTNKKLGQTATKNYENAINRLKELNNKYNVDVSSGIEKIQGDMFQKKQAVAQTIQSKATEYMNDGLSPEEAINKAEKYAPALDIPTSEGAGMSPGDIVRETTEASKGKEDKSQYDISQSFQTGEEPTRTKEPKKATLFGPQGEKEVVDVGSERASELQSQGFKLMEQVEKPEEKPQEAPAPETPQTQTPQIQAPETPQAESPKPKKATLYGPQGEAEVVDVGSQRASDLQSKGFKLEDNNKNKQ